MAAAVARAGFGLALFWEPSPIRLPWSECPAQSGRSLAHFLPESETKDRADRDDSGKEYDQSGVVFS